MGRASRPGNLPPLTKPVSTVNVNQDYVEQEDGPISTLKTLISCLPFMTNTFFDIIMTSQLTFATIIYFHEKTSRLCLARALPYLITKILIFFFYCHFCVTEPTYDVKFSAVRNISAIEVSWANCFNLNGVLQRYELLDNGAIIYAGIATTYHLRRTSSRGYSLFFLSGQYDSSTGLIAS